MGPIDLYFNPSGRINRSTYWLKGVLLLNVIWLVVWIVVLYLLLGDFELEDLLDPGYLLNLLLQLSVFFLLFSILHAWNSYSVAVKRLHDRDKSARWIVLWWAIAAIGGAITLGIATFIVVIWVFVELGCLEGTRGANRYGPATNPLWKDIPYQPGGAVSGSKPGGRIKTCPYCSEDIQYSAIKCRYCGSDLAQQTRSAPTRPCPHCGGTVGNSAVTCGHRGLLTSADSAVSAQPISVQWQPASRSAISPGRTVVSGSEATAVQGQPVSRPATSPGRTVASGSDATIASRPGSLVSTPGSIPGSTAQTPAPEPSQTMALKSDVASSMAWLVVTKGPSQGKSLQLKEGNNTIGRSLDNDLQIDDGSVSRSHAMVNVKDGHFTLVDMGSTSGTRIGDSLISGKRIGAGSSISVGRTRLQLVNVNAYQGEPSSGATMVRSPTGSSLSLVAQSGPDAGKSFLLTSAQNMIGRDPSAQVTLSDPTVSNHHAVIRMDADRTSLADLGSQAGTQVDGESVQGSRISVGERVVIGQSDFMLMRPNSL